MLGTTHFLLCRQRKLLPNSFTFFKKGVKKIAKGPAGGKLFKLNTNYALQTNFFLKI